MCIRLFHSKNTNSHSRIPSTGYFLLQFEQNINMNIFLYKFQIRSEYQTHYMKIYSLHVLRCPSIWAFWRLRASAIYSEKESSLRDYLRSRIEPLEVIRVWYVIDAVKVRRRLELISYQAPKANIIILAQLNTKPRLIKNLRR